ncbi:MAG: TldD/PmbA family protein [Candidatus Aegiribacteria sp.]
MRDRTEIAAFSLEALKKAGLEKSECHLRFTRSDELNLDSGEISLLRTTDDVSLTLTGIVENRKGSVTINRTDGRSLDEAAARVLDMAVSSEPDGANDISPRQPSGEFDRGPDGPDLDLMYRRMKDFLEYSTEKYPSLILEQAILDFSAVRKYYLNSNGVDLRSRRGCYSFFPMFTSKEGKDTSSFNYSVVSMTGLDRELQDYGIIDELMEQSTGQVRSREFQGKFSGDVIITPDCLEDFLSMTCMYLGDYPMIKGTSIFRDSLGAEIAHPGLTLRSMPLSDELAHGYFITHDGYAAADSTIIENGVLRTFLLSLYGSNKTGKARSVNSGGAFVVDPGKESREELVSSVKKGILLCRFSGGMPSESGDFSGVAKNSYYIEDGRIRHPVREIMISGNLRDLLMNLDGISSERVNSGSSILPWIKARDISIFGKQGSSSTG